MSEEFSGDKRAWDNGVLVGLKIALEIVHEFHVETKDDSIMPCIKERINSVIRTKRWESTPLLKLNDESKS